MLQAVRDQWVQRQIQDVAFERQQEIEQEERIIVGVNKFEVEDEAPEMDLEEVDPEQEQRQKANLEQVKADRDDDAVESALEAVRDAAQSDTNLMFPMIDAVKAYATVQEICDVLRDEFGEYQPGASI
ncbi:MAG: methylmalonyl-CoA mutase, N-terminal domain/subunit [uncultured archaeon A07HR60]|nr:MAG: methylmalonyl-CoA mutase, N-terminal domain/subunit [uncultured archaeon A07HR60]